MKQERAAVAQVATRKGLFEFTRGAMGWAITDLAFVGDPVNLTLTDPRDGALYAELDLGHFGVKLHRRDAGSGNSAWQEISVPVYPAQPPQTAGQRKGRGSLGRGHAPSLIHCSRGPPALGCYRPAKCLAIASTSAGTVYSWGTIAD